MSNHFDGLIFFILFLSWNSSLAFNAGFRQLGTTRSDHDDTTHYKMTICALCRVTIDYLRTYYKINTKYLEQRFEEKDGQCRANIDDDIINVLKTSSKYTVNPYQFGNTLEIIASANTKIDLKEMLEEDSHFDSESFVEGSQLVMKRYEATKQSILKEDNFNQARKTFGEMLHTLQDFYSHTNYIEIGNISPSEVLAQRLFREDEFAPISMRTCINCDNGDCRTKSNLDESFQKTKLLTSGYFIPIGLNIFQRDKPSGKCSHGGTFDTTSDEEPKGGINKDNLDASHGHLHYQAAAMAYQASVHVLNQLRREIGDENFGQFLTLKQRLNSLVICIQTIYSTVNFFDLAKNISTNIVNQYTSLEYAPHNYILVLFNNSDARIAVNSHQPNDLIKTIQTIQLKVMSKSIFGEMYYHSVIEGLKKSEYGSVIYTFTDSPAHDANMKFQARALLRNKATVIYSFIHAERVIDALPFSQLDPLDGSNNDTDLASISGGLTFPITDGDQSAISEFILRRLEWKRLKTLVMYKSNSSSIQFYVDSSIDTLLLDIASIYTIGNLSEVALQMPNNSYYPLTKTFTNTKYLYMWKIVKPSSGLWRLKTSNLTAGLNYDVQIQAKTNISCSSTLQEQMESNTDSTGYTQLTTEPIINSNLSILTICENLQFTSVNISLIDQSGHIIASYSPIRMDLLGASTRILVPEQRFRIQTIVTLSNGTLLQRMERQLISPTIYSIELRDRSHLLQPDQTINISYIIKSARSVRQTVRLQIIDTLNLLSNAVLEKDFDFVNQTSGIQTMTLPKNYQSTLTTNLITLSVSTLNNQTQKYFYQNDETASIYLDTNSSATLITTNIFATICVIFFYFYKTKT